MSQETILIHFLHPTDMSTLDVDLDPNISARDAVTGVIQAGFFAPPAGESFSLYHKETSRELQPNATFQQAGVLNDHTLRIVKATDAGSNFARLY